MFARLFPNEGKGFFDLFEQHARKTMQAAELLHQMLSSPADSEEQAKRIKMIEHEGDVITHNAVETLHKTFVTPIDRGDIHRLITRLDDILDLIEATSERAWLYEIPSADADAMQLASVLVESTRLVAQAMTGLRNLKDRDALLKLCMEINRYENEGDSILRNALARLFRNTTDPILIMKMKEVYDFLEDALDRCEDVANVLEGVALEYT
ncbi:MAG TPA: DUF47 family protein [Terriglobales bacterium]|nr:DUF47 family protein [Terriglobales bacterium]